MATPPVPPAMQAVVFDFDKDLFVRAEVPTPSPGPGELLVRVQACGLNPVDAKMRLWKSMVGTPRPAHHVPGLDVCGVVAYRSRPTDRSRPKTPRRGTLATIQGIKRKRPPDAIAAN